MSQRAPVDAAHHPGVRLEWVSLCRRNLAANVRAAGRARVRHQRAELLRMRLRSDTRASLPQLLLWLSAAQTEEQHLR
eukprot:CAMPEP_0173068778 /NCGR_PEP_ID=MMETSP1102-20130122/7620_1 /TAXON_ID=49646 /ORGANISM="Geminigera sp., Strain Caron Lab Isolate" /LENGTH=77 /DNA_ID=CAMNT_0013936713 /DNA_START=146 /DNA_END=375 /DNA_ORIENTATION=+